MYTITYKNKYICKIGERIIYDDNYRYRGSEYSYRKYSFSKNSLRSIFIFENINQCNNQINILIKEADKHYKDILDSTNTSPFRRKQAKEIHDQYIIKENYNHFELTPHFTRKDNAQNTKCKWEINEKMSLKCSACQTNIITNQYIMIGNYKLCPFCIEEMSVTSKRVIDDLERTIPNVRTKYKKNIFITSI
jgi:hypothetical protein